MMSLVRIHLGVWFLLISHCLSQSVITEDETNALYEKRYQFADLKISQARSLPEMYVRQTKLRQSYGTIVFSDDKNKLYVGGREILLDINSSDMTVNMEKEFLTTDTTLCQLLMDQLNENLCYNYVTIIQPLDNDCLFVCGTDSLSPKCYFVNSENLNAVLDDSYSGKRVAPRDPVQNSTWLYLKEESRFFSAVGMPVDGSGNSDGFRLADLPGCNAMYDDSVSEKNGPKWVNNPHFVGEPIDYGDHIYFFFREFATEHINAGRIVYPRVARVCKDDTGGLPFTDLAGNFLTYQKARLNCSIYNEIQDTYQVDKTVFAVFTTQQQGPMSSAVCVYNLDEIARVFDTSASWGTIDPKNLWSRPAPSLIPEPRPFQCSAEYPDKAHLYRYLEHFALMQTLVPNKLMYRKPASSSRPTDNTPLLVQDNIRFVEIVVNEDVDVGVDVFFLGTDRGTVVKAFVKDYVVELIEEIDFNMNGQPQAPILTMVKNDVTNSVYVGTDNSVYKLPYEMCSNNREGCKCIKDPNCSWSGTACRSKKEFRPGDPLNCPPKIEISNLNSHGNRTITKNETTNLDFAVSAPLGSNLSIDGISCNCSSDPLDQIRRKSVCNENEFLTLQFVVSVTIYDCRCRVTFAADSADNLVLESVITVDTSPMQSDPDCIQEVQDYDIEIAKYKQDVKSFKNNMCISEAPIPKSVIKTFTQLLVISSTSRKAWTSLEMCTVSWTRILTTFN